MTYPTCRLGIFVCFMVIRAMFGASALLGTSCPAGSEISEGVCVPCEFGTFKPTADNSLCSACASGSWAAGGATACTSCGANSVLSDEARTEYLRQWCTSTNSQAPSCTSSTVIGPSTQVLMTIYVEQTDFDKYEERITSVRASGQDVPIDYAIDYVLGDWSLTQYGYREYYQPSEHYQYSEDEDETNWSKCGYFWPVVDKRRVEPALIDGEWVLDLEVVASDTVNAYACGGKFLNAMVEFQVSRPQRSSAEDCECEAGYGRESAISCENLRGVVEEGSGTCFFLLEGGKYSWAEAEAGCAHEGAHLASITSAAENDIVAGLRAASGEVQAWIGLSDDRVMVPDAFEGSFRWSDGSPRRFTNWTRGQPNNYGLYGQDCTTTWIDQEEVGWQDDVCASLWPAVCAWRPEIGALHTHSSCVQCEAGKYSEGSVCLECPAGSFSSSAGASTCSQCAGASYAEGGATSCSTCPRGEAGAPGWVEEPRREVVYGSCASSATPRAPGDWNSGPSCATSLAVGAGHEMYLTIKVEQGDFEANKEDIRRVSVGGRGGFSFDRIAHLDFHTDTEVGYFSPGTSSGEIDYGGRGYLDYYDFSACGRFITIVDRWRVPPSRVDEVGGLRWLDVEVEASRGVDLAFCSELLNVTVELEVVRPLGLSMADCFCGGETFPSELVNLCLPWGRPELQEACTETRSWWELGRVFDDRGPERGMHSGGLGVLMVDGVFESWTCLRGHPCLADPRVDGNSSDLMCFVYAEAAGHFIPWGKDSELHLSAQPPSQPPQPSPGRRSHAEPAAVPEDSGAAGRSRRRSDSNHVPAPAAATSLLEALRRRRAEDALAFLQARDYVEVEDLEYLRESDLEELGSELLRRKVWKCREDLLSERNGNLLVIAASAAGVLALVAVAVALRA